MGDPRRFDIFSEYLKSRVPAEARVADVAAGKGYLALGLKQRGISKVVPFEIMARRRKRSRLVMKRGMRFRAFRVEDADGFDFLVGMHPDGATETIIMGAARSGCGFAIVPCCAVSSPGAPEYWGGRLRHDEWLTHLRSLMSGLGIQWVEDHLPMSGRNRVFRRTF